MKTAPPGAIPVHALERVPAIFGAVACVAITVVIWRNVSTYQDMWPLPACYFIEVTALSIISAVMLVRGSPASGNVMWGTVGVLGAFCVLGLFSVGLLYLPIFVAFAGAAVAVQVRNRQHFLMHLAICLLAALAQAALMLTAIRLLYPIAS